MKKILLILTALLILCPKSYSATEDNIALLTKQGFFSQPQQTSSLNPCDEIKRTLYMHNKDANNYNFDGLKSLYSDKYVNADGFDKEIYFDLVKKTWETYPNIKYKIEIKNISVNGTNAAVEVSESAEGTTTTTSGIVHEKGLLQSVSDSVYYMEKINNEWLITSDHILFEKTFLRYGSAKDLAVSITAPCQIPGNTQYTTSLNIKAPKDNFIIASIGQENITYPQTIADEVFRKLPDDGTLERVFKSNNKNINEYAVASFGVTKAEFNKGNEIKIYITGLGFVMSRVNVIPKNEFVKVTKNEKSK